MEVHHHPDLHHKKKNFKEYLKEFLMIFLAVTLGFFAENLREGFGDHHKAHQYAKTLIADIKLDTEECSNVILNMNYFIEIYDSLLLLLDEKNAPVNKMYYYFVPTNQYIYFNGTDRTIDQLKSTGQMRLFEDNNSSDTINTYYHQSKFVINYTSTYLKYFDEYHKDAFDLFAYSKMRNSFLNPKELLDSSKQLQLLDDDYKIRQKVYNKLFILKIISDDYIHEVVKLKAEGKNCINFLKKEFDIEQ